MTKKPTLADLPPEVTASFKSSNISFAEYDPFMKILSITFSTNTKYEYIDVEQEIFDELKEATSAGKYFNTQIKGKYLFLKKGKRKKKK